MYTVDKSFDKINFTEAGFQKGEYENCQFINCIFSNADISGTTFLDCEFVDCDLSMATINSTAFRDVKFKNCKLLGLHFHNCNQLMFAVNFEGCTLNLSSFHKVKIKNTKFKNCSLREVDMGFTDATGAIFDNCDMANALFESTILEKADFRTAYNYIINPDENKIKGAIFSAAGVVGLLKKYGIKIE